MADKDVYVEKMEGRLDTWKAKLDQLKGQSKEAGADAKIKYDEEIEMLKQQIDTVEKNISDLKVSGEAKLDEMREKADKMFDDISNRYNAVMDALKNKS